MSIPTAELSIAEITKLQEIFFAAEKPLGLREFIEAFRVGLRRRVDEKLMALLFALIDADDAGVISWVEFQHHIELVRSDAQQTKEKLSAVRQLFEDHVEQQEKQIKELYHTAPIIRVFQPDAETLLTASFDGTVKRWNAATLTHEDTLHYNTNGASDAYYEDASGLLVIANCDQTVSLYDVRTRKCLRSFLTCRTSIGDEVEVFRREFRYPLPTPKFTFQGRLAPELQGSVMRRYWESQHSNLLQRVWACRKYVERYAATSMPATTSDVTSVCCVGGEGKAMLYLGLDDGRLHVYAPRTNLKSDDDVAQAINPVATWRPHRSTINRVLCDPQEEVLITCGADNDIHMTHIERGIVLKTLRGSSEEGALTDRVHTRGVKGFAVSKAVGSKMLGSWGLERFAIMWDPLVGKPTHTLEGHLARLVDLQFSPADENLIFTYSEDHTTKIWDRRTYRQLQQLRDHAWDISGRPGCLHYDPTRKALITASHKLYWKQPTNRRDEESAAHTRPILSLSFCDEQQLLTSCDEGSVRLWDMKSMTLMSKWPIDNVHGIHVNANGTSVLVETGAEELKVYHSSNGQGALVLTGSAKPPYLAELDHRYLYWELGYWVVATPKQLLIYDATTDQKALMYPTPTYKKELWALTDRIIALRVCGSRLVLSLQDGAVLFLLVGLHQPMDPRHQPFIKLEALPRSYANRFPLWKSFLAGALHRPPRQMIVESNKLRMLRLATKDTASILEDIPDGASDLEDRVECISPVTDDLVVGSRNGGVLSLWNLHRRKEVFRFQVTVQRTCSITGVESAMGGALLFVADDSGYMSIFDMTAFLSIDPVASLPVCDSEATSSWYAQHIRRKRWFRVDVGVISDVAYVPSRRLLVVATTTPSLLVLSTEGDRIAALGFEYPPNPPTNSLPFETLLRQYRQEVLMQRADAGAFTAPELATFVQAHFSDVFGGDVSVATELLQDMCPDSADRERERLMEKTSAGIFIPLHAKPMLDADKDAPKKEPPLSSVQQVNHVPMVAVWQGASDAFRVSKQTKPFTRRIAGHAKLLAELEAAAAIAPAEGSLQETPADGGLVVGSLAAKRHVSVSIGDEQEADELTADFFQEERSTRSVLCDEAQAVHLAAVEACLLSVHATLVAAALDTTVATLVSIHYALRHQLLFFLGCIDPEFACRKRLQAAEQKGRDTIAALTIEGAAALAHAKDQGSLVMHRLADGDAHAPVSEPLAACSDRDNGGRMRRARTPPPPQLERSARGRVLGRTASTPERRRCFSQSNVADPSLTASWRGWKLPVMSDCHWHTTWALSLDDVPLHTAEAFARKEARIQGLLLRFKQRCAAAVEAEVAVWQEDKARQQRFQWTTNDGIHLHCVSNPVNARTAGSMKGAVKAASREIGAQQAIVAAQRHASIRLHVPLSCVVHWCGLVFYCSAVVPVSADEEVSTWGEHLPATTVVDAATHQLFRELRMEEPRGEHPASIPSGVRRYVSKRSGRLWIVGLRAVFPSLGPQAGDASMAARRMRPEAVASATALMCSRSFSNQVPLLDRRRADRDGIKVIRNVTTVLVDNTAQALLDAALRGTMPLHGKAIVERMHKTGLNVSYLAVVTFKALRLCTGMGIVRRAGSRKAAGSTVGVLKAADHRGHADTPDDVGGASAVGHGDFAAPQMLLMVLTTELIARTFRHTLEEELRKVFFGNALQRRDATKRITKTALAQEIASRLVNNLLTTGNSIPSLQFWNDKMVPNCVSHFWHGEYSDRIGFDECDVGLVRQRVQELCGLCIHQSVDGEHSYSVESWAPVAKTIQYRLPFSEQQLLMYGVEHHDPCATVVRNTLRSLVGPERWWLERHALRMVALARVPSAMMTTTFPTGEHLPTAAFWEFQQLEAIVDGIQGTFDVATKTLQMLIRAVEDHPPMPKTMLPRLLITGTLLDLYEWTGQHGLYQKAAEAYLSLVQAGIAHEDAGVSFLDVSLASKTVSRVYLAIPANVRLHRAARDLLLQRFDALRRHLSPTHDLTLTSLMDLAACHVEMEEEYEGIEIMRRLQSLAEQTHGKHDAFVCTVMESIGQALAQVGDFPAAIDMFYSSLVRRNRGYPDDAAERSIPHLLLVETHLRRNNIDAAVTAMHGASTAVGSLPFDSPVLLRKLALEAQLAERNNDHASAIAAWTKLLDARERTWGSLSTHSADALMALGVLLFNQQRYHESWHCFDVCCGIRCKLMGRYHPSVAMTMAWLARSEAAAGNCMEAVEVFQVALALFDEMCVEDSSGTTFPNLKAQALVDMATLLFKDVEDAHKLGTPLDVKRLMVVGRSHQAELRRAMQYLQQAESLMLPIVQDPHHASIRAMRVLTEACEQLIVRVTHDEETSMSAAERTKRIDTWGRPQSERTPDRSLTADALWYRKHHRIFKLK